MADDLNDIRVLRARMKEIGENSFGMSKAQMQEIVGGRNFDGPPDVKMKPAPAQDRAERQASRGEETGRRTRRPLGMPRAKLAYPSRPGYVRRWFNDNGNRVKDALDAGYTFVKEEHDGREVKVRRRVGVQENGAPLEAALMEIRQEFYDEDQREKQKVNDQIDAAILRKNNPPQEATPQDRDAFYTPSEGTSITHDN